MAKSQFSELFEHYDDLYGALKVVVERDYEKSGSVDPAEVVRELLAARPDISLSPAELLAEVVQAAAAARVPIMVKSTD